MVQRSSNGRVCRRLRSLLEALGLTDVVLRPAQGSWRTDVRLDVYRWEGRCKMPPNGNGYEDEKSLCSWFTMTACASAGAVLVEPDDDFSLIVSPNPGRPSRLITSKRCYLDGGAE